MSTINRRFAARITTTIAALALAAVLGVEAHAHKEVEYWGYATQAPRAGVSDPGADARLASRAGNNDKGASAQFAARAGNNDRGASVA
jgi:hypothetical protein